jgi:ABC-2 type transport system ATP-binding protein
MVAVIELQGVTQRYGDVVALEGVDLTVARGEVVALLGPNGAGKSTVFELVLGLLRPTDGRVTVLGEPPGRSRHRVGAMVQGAGLPEDATARELVRLVGRSYPAQLPVEEALRRAGLADRAERLVGVLSGGERQRLLLALVLVGAPELLLLDEPTVAMDVTARRGFWRHTRAAAAVGATVVVATHHLDEAAAVADRVVVLLGGRVVADATPDELTDALAGGGDLERAYLDLTGELEEVAP